MNLVVLVGTVIVAPELRVLPSGKSVTALSVRTQDVLEGEWTDEYHRVVAWDRLAAVTAQYLKHGDTVVVHGRLQTRGWEDDRKLKHYRTEVIAEAVTLQPRARLFRNMLAEVRA